mmetsp:Transcript_4225/g.10711  ORF Transcript_4225/g.10711 Transcript_4225/m.10711 type:complete len:263 (-) Transcript_4225:622-1410(-)
MKLKPRQQSLRDASVLRISREVHLLTNVGRQVKQAKRGAFEIKGGATERSGSRMIGPLLDHPPSEPERHRSRRKVGNLDGPRIARAADDDLHFAHSHRRAAPPTGLRDITRVAVLYLVDHLGPRSWGALQNARPKVESIRRAEPAGVGWDSRTCYALDNSLVPVCRSRQPRPPCSSAGLGDKRTRQEAHHAHPALEKRVFPAAQRRVCAMIQGAAIVRYEDDDRIVPHLFFLERFNHRGDAAIHFGVHGVRHFVRVFDSAVV